LRFAVALIILGLGLTVVACGLYLGLAAASPFVAVSMELLGAVVTTAGVFALLVALRPTPR